MIAVTDCAAKACRNILDKAFGKQMVLLWHQDHSWDLVVRLPGPGMLPSVCNGVVIFMSVEDTSRAHDLIFDWGPMAGFTFQSSAVEPFVASTRPRADRTNEKSPQLVAQAQHRQEDNVLRRSQPQDAQPEA